MNKFKPRHKWIEYKRDENLQYTCCQFCKAKSTLPLTRVGSTNAAFFRKIIEGQKDCFEKNKPVPLPPVPIRNEDVMDSIERTPTTTYVPKYVKPSTTVSKPSEPKLSNDQARLKECLVFLWLSYEELVKLGSRSATRHQLGRFLYSQGYDELIKKLDPTHFYDRQEPKKEDGRSRNNKRGDHSDNDSLDD